MKFFNIRNIVIIICLLRTELAFAIPKHPTVGEIAKDLMVGAGVVTQIMHVVCIGLGVLLCILSIFFYKAHRENPKFVPLDRPILYLILGLVLIAVPFLGKILAPTGSILDMQRREAEENRLKLQDIDAPLHWGNDYDH